MGSFKEAAEKQENGMAFGVKGDGYMDAHMRSQIKAVITGWMNGQEKDCDLHAALNALEDESGAPSWMRKICDDIRTATMFDDLDERERYIEVVRPRIRALLSGL